MAFKQYQHLERFGNTEVESIELGVCYVFPKIDGTNASMWCEDGRAERICAGSRTRQLSYDSDNAGFHAWALSPFAKNHREFLWRNKNLRLYGEWLVPHTFKGYRQEAWNKFYVFDVYNDDTESYIPYEVYKPLLEMFGVEYIPPLAVVKSGNYEQFLKYVHENLYLCPDGGAAGEGVVLKNYDYQNKFGRCVFAKIVRQEFKEAHHKAMGAPEINGSLMNEERIVNAVVNAHLIDKTINKIKLDRGDFTNRDIPQLLGTVFYDVVREELWDQLKAIEFGTVNFKTLKALVINKIKELKPEVFTRSYSA